MTDFIYPECPVCGNVPSEGEGVSLSQVIGGVFEWRCPACFRLHKGRFGHDGHEVEWLKTKEPTPHGILRSVLRNKLSKLLS